MLKVISNITKDIQDTVSCKSCLKEVEALQSRDTFRYKKLTQGSGSTSNTEYVKARNTLFNI